MHQRPCIHHHNSLWSAQRVRPLRAAPRRARGSGYHPGIRPTSGPNSSASKRRHACRANDAPAMPMERRGTHGRELKVHGRAAPVISESQESTWGADLLPSLSCHIGVSRVNIRAGSLAASLAISFHAQRVVIRASCTIAGSSCHRVAWVESSGPRSHARVE